MECHILSSSLIPEKSRRIEGPKMAIHSDHKRIYAEHEY